MHCQTSYICLYFSLYLSSWLCGWEFARVQNENERELSWGNKAHSANNESCSHSVPLLGANSAILTKTQWQFRPFHGADVMQCFTEQSQLLKKKPPRYKVGLAFRSNIRNGTLSWKWLCLATNSIKLRLACISHIPFIFFPFNMFYSSEKSHPLSPQLQASSLEPRLNLKNVKYNEKEWRRKLDGLGKWKRFMKSFTSNSLLWIFCSRESLGFFEHLVVVQRPVLQKLLVSAELLVTGVRTAENTASDIERILRPHWRC